MQDLLFTLNNLFDRLPHLVYSSGVKVSEAAKLSKLSVSAIRHHINAGHLPATRNEFGEFQILKSDFTRWLAKPRKPGRKKGNGK